MARRSVLFAGVVYLVCVLSIILLGLAGCAPSYHYHYPGHSTFTPGNFGLVTVGMTSEDVIAILGDPDKTFDAEFGADVGEPWVGRVWLYFIREDLKYTHARRYRKATFVFYPPGTDMRLNHWRVEG